MTSDGEGTFTATDVVEVIKAMRELEYGHDAKLRVRMRQEDLDRLARSESSDVIFGLVMTGCPVVVTTDLPEGTFVVEREDR